MIFGGWWGEVGGRGGGDEGMKGETQQWEARVLDDSLSFRVKFESQIIIFLESVLSQLFHKSLDSEDLCEMGKRDH